MFTELFLFELKYRARRFDTYFYFIALFLFSIISIDFIFEGQLTTLLPNSPIVIARTMGIVSALFLMIVSMIAGTSVLRDFTQNSHVLLFSFPFTKTQYLLSRFLGSFVVVVLIFTAMPLGMMLTPLLPWHETSELLSFKLWPYIQPFLGLIVPTLFFSSALFFVTGLLTRKLLLVYIQGFFFLLIYLFSLQLAVGSDDLFLTTLIEPFTFQSVRIITGSWSIADRVSAMVSIDGVLLANRLLWFSLGIITLGIGYARFQFNVPPKSSRTQKRKLHNVETPSEERESKVIETSTNIDTKPNEFRQLFHHTAFNLRLIVSEISFWAILLCAAGILLINGFSLGTNFGVDNLPTTYLIVGELVELTFFFFIGIILFYSGELMWKERDEAIHLVTDALPVQNWVQLTGKVLGLLSLLIILMVLMIATGIGFQAAHGYFDFEIELYLLAFFVEIFPFLMLISVVSFISQVLVNQKYVAHFITAAFLFITTAGFAAIDLNHDLISFGGSLLPTYSDMNGFSYMMSSYLWIKSYWLAITFWVFVLMIPLLPRGSESSLRERIGSFASNFTPSLKVASGLVLAGFLISGSLIFYHTNIANTYYSEKDEHQLRADYEQSFGFITELPHPEMTDVYLELDVFPSALSYQVRGRYQLENKTSNSISEFYLQKLPNDHVLLQFPDQPTIVSIDSANANFGLYKINLSKPMMPGDSLELAFRQSYRVPKFSSEFSPYLVANGTLIDDYHLPSLGYLDDIEIADPKLRAEFGLPEKLVNPIDDVNSRTIGKANGNGEYIDLEVIVSTDLDQRAIAPGTLIKKWKQDDRAYFHYTSDQKISNLFSIVSANYELIHSEIELQDSASVALEIYHHSGHEFNTKSMMLGMKHSLEYFSKHFSAYQFDHLRIVEVPIYHDRAQSIPGMITVAENMGFTLEPHSESVPDLPFFITAHEVAHQWWGDQVNAADVPGQLMIAETLSQYSALMVFRQRYGEDKTNELLKWNMRQYFKNRAGKDEDESPLNMVKSGDDYVYYRKGLIVMNALEQLISEENINAALSSFINDWNSKSGTKHIATNRYPTTDDLLNYLYEATPLTKKGRVKELLESVIIYDNEIKDVNAIQLESGDYQLKLTLELNKLDVSDWQVEREMDFNHPVEIGFYSVDEHGELKLIEIKEIHPQNGEESFTIELSEQPHEIIIDPKMMLLDKDWLDNRMGVGW